MRVEHLLDLVTSGTNTLVHPTSWDDPFENLILRSRVRLADGTTTKFAFHDHYVGQCWSRHRETDLMWRAYSPNQDRVKVRTTIRRLHDSLYDGWNEFRDISCFVGKVLYLKRPQYSAVLESAFLLDNTNVAQAQTLLLKRFGFRSEAEVRVVVDFGAPAPKHVTYPVDANYLIDEVVIDPRMKKADVQKVKASLRAAGLKKPVVQSGLYKKPPGTTIQIG